MPGLRFRHRWLQFRLRTLFVLVTLTALGLAGWKYWESTRLMREAQREILEDVESLTPPYSEEEKELLLRLVWDHKTWQLGLIDYLGVYYPGTQRIGFPARLVWSGAFRDSDGSNHQVFLFERCTNDPAAFVDYGCVITDERGHLRHWRVLDDVIHEEVFQSTLFYRETTIQSKPSPVLSLVFDRGTYRCHVSPEAIRLDDIHLPFPDDVQELNVSKGVRITEPFWLALGELPNLRILNLARTEVDDTDLARLRSLTDVERLIVPSNSITPEGIRQLQEALPDCVIQHEDEDEWSPPPTSEP